MLQTADVDAKIMVEVSLLVCGSSSCSAAVEMVLAAATMDADVAAMTVVCGSSYCLYSAADAAETSVADAAATADANHLFVH